MPKRYKQTRVNLEESEHDRLTAMASSKGITLAELLRQGVNTEVDNAPSPRKKVIYKQTDPKVLFHLSKIGNNINQVAKYLNEGNPLESRLFAEILNDFRAFKNDYTN